MKKSIKLNSVLNIIRKCCNIIIPLFTFPYVSRILGPINYGKFSFSSSIINYFLLAALLGVETYAVREGARIRNDKNKIEKFISEVFSINILSMFFSYIVLIVLAFFNKTLSNYKEIILILSPIIPLTVLGREYINTIFEDYMYITFRYIIIQIIGIVAIYLFIKNANDYLMYTIIYMLVNILGYIINLFYTQKYCSLRITKHLNLRKHIIPIMVLFCGQLAVNIYIQSDITMLGVFRTDKEVGIYSITSKIYMLTKGMINAITLVALPRISYYLGRNEKGKYNAFSNKLIQYIFLLVMPIMIGLLLFSKEILYIIGGKEYFLGNTTLMILSFALFFAVFSSIFCNGIMISNRKEKQFLIITSISAILNIVLNLFLIPAIGMIGAAISTLVSEIVVFFTSLLTTREYLKIRIDKNNLNTVFIGTFFVFFVGVLCKIIFKGYIIQFIAAFLLSCFVYLMVLILLKNKIVMDILKIFLKLFQNRS